MVRSGTVRAKFRGLRRLIPLSISFVTVTACHSESVPKAEKAAAASSAGAPRDVALDIATELSVEQVVEVSGTLAADEQVTVAAKVAGRLTSISVDLASPVKEGEVIAQLETTDYALRVQQAQAALSQAQAQLGIPQGSKSKALPEETAIVRQARATLNEAQANLQRSRALAQEGLVSGMQLDAAEAAAVRAETAVQSALEEVRIRQASVGQRRSELSIARQQLADTTLRSPLNGVVQQRLGSVGEYLAAGAPVAQIVKINPLRLRLSVPERDAGALAMGQPVQVRVDGDPATYTGTLARVAPALELQSRTLLVEADIPNPGSLRPGNFVRASIVTGTERAVTVKKNAVVNFAGLTKVITVKEGRAVEKRIVTGKQVGDRIQVRSGLSVGESVVVEPGSLQQGHLVRVKALAPAVAEPAK